MKSLRMIYDKLNDYAHDMLVITGNIIFFPLLILWCICKYAFKFIEWIFTTPDMIVGVVFCIVFGAMLFIEIEEDSNHNEELHLKSEGFEFIYADNVKGVPQYNAAELLVMKRLDNKFGIGQYELFTTNFNGKVWYKVNVKQKDEQR